MTTSFTAVPGVDVIRTTVRARRARHRHLLLGPFVRFRRPQYAELVSLRVGQHNPGRIEALPDEDAGSTERLKPPHFCRLVNRT